MPSKKEHHIYAIEELKKSILELESDMTKLHINLKRIAQKIYYLDNSMIAFLESSEESESDSESNESDKPDDDDYYTNTYKKKQSSKKWNKLSKQDLTE